MAQNDYKKKYQQLRCNYSELRVHLPRELGEQLLAQLKKDNTKIADFIKTTFFLSKSSEYSSNDVHKVIDYGRDKKKAKDDKTDQDEAKAVFFFTKMELLK